TCPPRDTSPPTTSPASAPRPKSSPANVAATPTGTNPPTAQLSTASVSHHVAPATRPAPSPHIMLRTRILRHRSHLVTFRKVCRAGFCRPRHAAGPTPPGHHSRCPPPPPPHAPPQPPPDPPLQAAYALSKPPRSFVPVPKSPPARLSPAAPPPRPSPPRAPLSLSPPPDPRRSLGSALVARPEAPDHVEGRAAPAL